uniref:VWFA domain-containing protein n=1 Tax=Poecilia mexicana TaxID=48701 RepID=A0A3B3YQY7_9TELE
ALITCSSASLGLTLWLSPSPGASSGPFCLLSASHCWTVCGRLRPPLISLCKARPTDLVFIVDSSRSVRPSEFEQVKVFLTNVINGLNVGPNATRVGVVNYASRVKNEVSMKTHRTKIALVKAVSKIEPLSTGTMTGSAIQFALNVAFSEAEGARAKSPDVSKVAIIVTDGRPQDNVKDVAQRARDAGIEIFAIGVGRVDLTTLRQMASEPLDDHVDYVESYSVIEKLTKKFQEAFCGKMREPPMFTVRGGISQAQMKEKLDRYYPCLHHSGEVSAGPFAQRVRCQDYHLLFQFIVSSLLSSAPPRQDSNNGWANFTHSYQTSLKFPLHEDIRAETISWKEICSCSSLNSLIIEERD